MDRFELAPPHFATFGQYGQKYAYGAYYARNSAFYVAKSVVLLLLHLQ